MPSSSVETANDSQGDRPEWLEAVLEQQRLDAEAYRDRWERQASNLESNHASLMRAIEASRDGILAQLQSYEHRLKGAAPSATVPDSAWGRSFSKSAPPQQAAPAAQEEVTSQGDQIVPSVPSTSAVPGAAGSAVQSKTVDRSQDKDYTPVNVVPESDAVTVLGQKNGGLNEKVAGPLCAKTQSSKEGSSGLQRFADSVRKTNEHVNEAHESEGSAGSAGPQPFIQSVVAPTSGSLKKLWLMEHGDADQQNSLRQRLVRFVNGPFDIVMVFVIVLNACFMFLQTEWHGAQAGHSLGQSETFWEGASSTFSAIDTTFLIIYSAELILRVSVLRSEFFWDESGGIGFANVFDFALLGFVYLDIIVFASLGGANLGILRFLRMAKLARALRLVRVLKAFQQLRLLTFAIAASLPAFLWSMAILSVLNVIAGMILTQILNEYVMDGTNDLSTRQWVNDNYGSGVKASYTMFMATHSGCWPNYAAPLVDKVHPAFAVFWIVYVGGVIFAIIKIITAVFIGETMKAASSDAVTAVTERMKATNQYIEKLKGVFESADVSGDGVLTKEEFRGMLTVPTIKHYLSHLDIEVHDAEGLFDLLDDGDGQVTLSEFVQGVTRMKGQARSADMVSLMYDNKITHEQGKEVLRKLLDILHKLDGVEHPRQISA